MAGARKPSRDIEVTLAQKAGLKVAEKRETGRGTGGGALPPSWRNHAPPDFMTRERFGEGVCVIARW